MPLSTFEGIVENGQIRLRDNVALPEKTRVYVLIPETGVVEKTARVHSPRLAHSSQIGDFEKQVIEVSADAGL